MNAGGAEASFYRHLQSRTDVPIMRAGVQVRLQVAWQLQVHAAITGVDGPAGCDL